MLVKATKLGFYNKSRQRVGSVFEMAGVKVDKNQIIDKSGKVVSWVVPAKGEGAGGPKARGAIAIQSMQTDGETQPGEQDEADTQ